MSKKTPITTLEPAKPRTRHVIKAKENATPEDLRRDVQTLLASPELRAVSVMQASNPMPEAFDVPDMTEELRAQIKKVQAGDMSRVEAMLITQAITLEGMFTNMAMQAMAQTQLPPMEGLMRMALRAQNQCRATLETLAAIKNPPVIFAKQANFAGGHQQINNAPAHTGKVENKPNELLEVTNHERLDTRAASQTSGNDSQLEAVANSRG